MRALLGLSIAALFLGFGCKKSPPAQIATAPNVASAASAIAADSAAAGPTTAAAEPVRSFSVQLEALAPKLPTLPAGSGASFTTPEAPAAPAEVWSTPTVFFSAQAVAVDGAESAKFECKGADCALPAAALASAAARKNESWLVVAHADAPTTAILDFAKAASGKSRDIDLLGKRADGTSAMVRFRYSDALPRLFASGAGASPRLGELPLAAATLAPAGEQDAIERGPRPVARSGRIRGGEGCGHVAVGTAVRQRMRDFSRCYAQARAEQPEFEGEAELIWGLEATGHVSGLAFKGAGANLEPWTKCVGASMSQIVFPAPPTDRQCQYEWAVRLLVEEPPAPGEAAETIKGPVMLVVGPDGVLRLRDGYSAQPTDAPGGPELAAILKEWFQPKRGAVVGPLAGSTAQGLAQAVGLALAAGYEVVMVGAVGLY